METRTMAAGDGVEPWGGSGRSLVPVWATLLTAVLAVGAFFVPFPLETLLVVVIVGVIVVLGVLRSRKRSFDYLEVIFPFSVLYFLYFGVGTLGLLYWPQYLQAISLRPYIRPALLLGTVAYLAFVAGYTVFARNVRPSAIGRLQPTTPLVALIPGAIGFVGSIAGALQYRLAAAGASISAGLSLLQQFAPVFLFAWAMAWYLLWTSRKSRAASVLVLIAMSGMAVGVVYSLIGTKGTAITLAGLPALSFWYARRRFPVKTAIVIFLLAVFVIFPLYNTYRLTRSELGTASRLDHTMRLAQKWDTRTYVDNSFFAFVRRMTVVTSVASVLRDAGRYVDFRYGDTLFLAPLGLAIPRFLWPEKPDINIGREFGVTFHLINPVDTETKIAPTVVAEFYWNFHVPGVLLGMLLLGAGYRWIYMKFGNALGGEPVRAAFYLTLLTTALHFEGNVAMLVGGFVRTGLILMVVIVLLERLGALRRIEPAVARPSGAAGAGSGQLSDRLS